MRVIKGFVIQLSSFQAVQFSSCLSFQAVQFSSCLVFYMSSCLVVQLLFIQLSSCLVVQFSSCLVVQLPGFYLSNCQFVYLSSCIFFQLYNGIVVQVYSCKVVIIFCSRCLQLSICYCLVEWCLQSYLVVDVQFSSCLFVLLVSIYLDVQLSKCPCVWFSRCLGVQLSTCQCVQVPSYLGVQVSTCLVVHVFSFLVVKVSSCLVIRL